MAMTRAEHLKWCKDRAMEYVRIGDMNQAFASISSDLMKHDETQMHESTNRLGLQLLLSGHLSTVKAMTEWIQGYN